MHTCDDEKLEADWAKDVAVAGLDLERIDGLQINSLGTASHSWITGAVGFSMQNTSEVIYFGTFFYFVYFHIFKNILTKKSIANFFLQFHDIKTYCPSSGTNRSINLICV